MFVFACDHGIIVNATSCWRGDTHCVGTRGSRLGSGPLDPEPLCSESTSHPAKMTCGLIRAKQASRRDGAWRAAVHGCLPSATTARLPPTSSAGAWSCLQLRQQPAVALVSAVAGCATTGDPDTRESQRLTPACRNAHLRGSTWPSAADLPSTRAVRHARHPLPPAIGVAFNLIGLEVQ